jgi:hypothetical protein
MSLHGVRRVGDRCFEADGEDVEIGSVVYILAYDGSFRLALRNYENVVRCDCLVRVTQSCAEHVHMDSEMMPTIPKTCRPCVNGRGAFRANHRNQYPRNLGNIDVRTIKNDVAFISMNGERLACRICRSERIPLVPFGISISYKSQ